MKPRFLVLCLAGVLSADLALAGTPARPVTGQPAARTDSAENPRLVPPAETCPRGLIHALLSTATEQNDIVSALGIERETLKLCRDRQQIVTEIYRLEGELRSLQAASEPTPAAPTRTRPSVEFVRPAPAWSWFSIIGVPGQLQAGVTDGQGVWFVREGDNLRDSVRVGKISVRPPGVHLSTGTVPYKPVPVKK